MLTLCKRAFHFSWVVLLFLKGIPSIAGVIEAPAELVMDGVPALSEGLISETAEYTDYRPTSFVDWHPHELSMLVLQRPQGGTTSQLFEMTEGGALTQLTQSKERVLGATYEPVSGSYIVFSRDEGGSERAQNYRLDLDDKKVTLLTDGKSKNSLGIWSRSGDLMAYRSNERNGKDGDFYLLNPLHPETKRRFAEVSEGDAWQLYDWSPDDSEVLALLYKSVNESSIWMIDVATGEKTPIVPQGTEGVGKVSYSDPKFSADGRSIFVITDLGSEFARLARIDLASRRLTFLTTHTPWDVESFELSPMRDQIATVTNEDGISNLSVHTLDADLNISGTLHPENAPISAFGGISWHPTRNFAAASISTASSTGDVFQINMSKLEFERRSFSNPTRTQPYTEPKLVKWTASDGLRIPGFLYQPSPTQFPGKRPVMVVIHGGPESQFRPGFLGRNNFYLDQLGVALLFPNIRGSTGYGKTFVSLPNGTQREKAYEDLNAMLDWIKTQPDLDGDRIFVTGGSYGGHATLAIASRYPEKIRCALDNVGMSNLVTFLEKTEPYRQDLRREIYGDERIPEVREFLERIAPLNHADQMTKPIFILQGQNDPRVPYTEAEQMVKVLKQIGTPVWYMKAMNEGHGFSKKPNQDYQFYSTVEFMRRYLLNDDSTL